MRRRPLSLAALCTILVGCGGSEASPTEEPQDSGAAGPRVSTVATGLEAPWEIAFLPDGRALVSERPGRIRLLEAGGRLRPDPAATVAVQAVGEGGLLGLAIDPAFADNRLVYAYRTTATGNEVLRLRMEGDRLGDPVVVAGGIQAAAIHDGGRLRFGPDDRLYFSAGDAAQPELAQDPESLNGKLLSLSPAQYRRGEGVRPAVFSLGHRNPQGFDWQPGTNRLVSNEHGPDGDDELNLIERGANYGWPRIRGEQAEGGLQTPVAVYPDSIAPSGSTFVRREGSAWTGDYLMASLTGERLQRVSLNADGRVTGQEALFDGRFGRLRSVVEGPDGGLYVLTNNTDGRGSPNEGDDQVLRVVPPPA